MNQSPPDGGPTGRDEDGPRSPSTRGRHAANGTEPAVGARDAGIGPDTYATSPPPGSGPAGGPNARHAAATSGPDVPDDDRPPPRTKSPWLIPLILGTVLLLILGALFVTNLVMADEDAPGDAIDGTSVAATDDASDDAAAEGTEGATAGSTTEPTDAASATASEEPAQEGVPTPSDRELNTTPLTELLDQVIVDTGFELSEDGWQPDPEAVENGAREAVTGVYTDGRTEVVATAAAFDTMAAHDAYAERLVAQQPAADLTTAGTVYVDDTGYFWAFRHPDDRATIIWRTDIGVVLSVTGESAATEEVFANMSL